VWRGGAHKQSQKRHSGKDEILKRWARKESTVIVIGRSARRGGGEKDCRQRRSEGKEASGTVGDYPYESKRKGPTISTNKSSRSGGESEGGLNGKEKTDGKRLIENTGVIMAGGRKGLVAMGRNASRKG